MRSCGIVLLLLSFCYCFIAVVAAAAVYFDVVWVVAAVCFGFISVFNNF